MAAKAFRERQSIMKTQEIPKNEWTGFFDSFSRKHEGWLVNLEIFGPDIGAQIEEREKERLRSNSCSRGEHVFISIGHTFQVCMYSVHDLQLLT